MSKWGSPTLLYMLRLWVHNNVSPLITGSHSLLAQDLPSLLHPGVLHASIPTVVPLALPPPKGLPSISFWLFFPFLLCPFTTDFVGCALLRWEEGKNHWLLSLRTSAPISPCWLKSLLMAVAIKSLSSLIVLFLCALFTLQIQLKKSRAGRKLWHRKSGLLQDCYE